MSTAHNAPSAHAHGAHSAHDFDGEPATALPADEPRTPAWVPILGVILFSVAGLSMLVCGDDAASTQSSPSAAASPEGRPGAALEGRPAVVQPVPQPANVLPPAGALGAPDQGSPNLRKLTPEQAKALQERIGAARAGQAPPGGNPPGAAPPPAPPPLRPAIAPRPAGEAQ